MSLFLENYKRPTKDKDKDKDKAATKTKSQSSSSSKPKQSSTTKSVNSTASKSTFMGGGYSTQKVEQAVSKPKSTQKKNPQEAAQNVIERSSKSTAMGGTPQKVQTSAEKRAERRKNADANLNLKQTKIQESKTDNSIMMRRADRRAREAQAQKNGIVTEEAKKREEQREKRRQIGQAMKSGDYDRASKLTGTAQELTAHETAKFRGEKAKPLSRRAKVEQWDKDIADTVKSTIKQQGAGIARVQNLGMKGMTDKDAFLYTTEDQRRKAAEKAEKRDTQLGKVIDDEATVMQKIQDKHGYAGKKVLEATSTLTGMGMDIAANSIIPGSGLFFMAARSTGTSLGQVEKKAANLRKQLEQSGQYSKEELDEMFKDVKARDMANATVSGGIEYLSEKMFGGFGVAAKYMPKGASYAEKIGSKLLGKAASKLPSGFLGNFVKGNIEEGLEEEAGGRLQAWAANLIYGNKYQSFQEDAMKKSLMDESNALRSNIHSEADAQAAAAKLSSKAFLNESIKMYQDSGYLKAEATKLAEMSRDYLTASLSGDVDSMKKHQDDMVNIMTGGDRSMKESWGLQDSIDSWITTGLVSLSGIPGSISTAAIGESYKQNMGMGVVRKQAEQIKNISSDPKDKAKAQAVIDHIDKGGDLSGTQVYEIIQKAGEVAEDSKQPEEMKNRTAKVEMDKRDLRISPINPDGTLAPQTQQRFEQIVEDTVSRHETLARLSNGTEQNEDFVGPAATFSKRNTNTEQENMGDVLIGANIGAAFKVGAINAEMVNELARGSDTVKSVFREVTGIDVSQFSSYEEMNNSLMAEAADNMVNSARIEQIAWNDESRKQVSDYVRNGIKSSQGKSLELPKGDLAIQNALESVDPRDRTQFLLTADVAGNLYDYARHTEGSWDEAKKMVKQMYPSVDTNAMKEIFDAAKKDKEIAETKGYGKVIKSGEKLNRRSLANAEAAVVPGKFTDQRVNKEGATLTEESLAKNIVDGFGLNVILTDQAEVRDEKGNLLVNLGSVVRDKDGNVVVDEEGNPVMEIDNGAFLDKSNTLVIYAGADATRTVTQTAVHELTHHIAVHAPKEYVKLSKYIMDAWYRKDPEGFTRAIKARQRLYKERRNQILSDEQALEEIIADGAADFDWADEDFIADVTTNEPTLASKIIDAIKDVLQKIRNILASGNVIDDRARDALYDKAVELDTVQAMWLKAAQTARKAQADQAVDEWQNRANGNSVEDEYESGNRYSSNWDRGISALTGEPVSQEYKDAVEYLENGGELGKEGFDVDWYNSLPEVQEARKRIGTAEETINDNSPERLKLREKWVQDLMNYGSATDVIVDGEHKTKYNGIVRQDKRIDIIVGLPSSGKSSALVDPISFKYKSRLLDSDEAKKLIPEFDDGWGAGRVHEESSQLLADAFLLSLERGDNIVMPIVGKTESSIIKRAKLAKEHGYKVYVRLCDMPPNIAAARNMKRFINRGRFVDLAVTSLNVLNGPKESFDAIVEKGDIDGYTEVSNNVERGQNPEFIRGEDDISYDWRTSGQRREGVLGENRSAQEGTEKEVRYSITPEMETEYAEAVEDGSMLDAQTLVDEAARIAGFDTDVYHGTSDFGFTQIKTSNLESKSDGGYYEWSPFFATDSLEVAQTYSSTSDIRRINEPAEPFDPYEFRDDYYEAVNNLVAEINSFAGVYNYVDYLNNPYKEAYKKIDLGLPYKDIVETLEDDFNEMIQELAWDKANDIVDESPDLLEVDEAADIIQDSPAVHALWDTLGNVTKRLKLYAEKSVPNSGIGNYALKANTSNMMKVDAKGHRWNDIPFDAIPEKRGYYRTRELAEIARDEGYDGIQIANLFDDGGKGIYEQNRPATVYIFFKPESQVRSGDPVTYDDNGNVIPLSERFNTAQNDIRYSVQANANAIGLEFRKRGEASVLIDKDGNEVSEVTREMVVNSPLGNILTESVRKGILPEAVIRNEHESGDPYDEVDFVADVMNMILRTQNIDMLYAISGTLGYDPTNLVDDTTPIELLKEKGSRFLHIRSNSENQYGTTVDFTTICVKTQAVIDAMSAVMKKRKDGLTKEEVINIVYKEVYNAGEQVPCPVCYVFSRWVGLGGIFDTMRDLQVKFPEDMDTEDIRKEFSTVVSQVDKLIAESEKSDKKLKGTKAREMYYKLVQDRLNELDQIEFYSGVEALKDKYTFTDEMKAEKAKLSRELELLDAWSWLKNTRLQPTYKPVPLDVLYDINAGKEFAESYPDSWKFRTTRGAGMGKAAVPYTPAILGNTIMGINSGGKVDVSKRGSNVFTDLSKNPFLHPGTERNAKSIKTRIANAYKKVRAQNVMNGQRLQSTSDFRFEYALDYLMNFLEFSALGAKAQLYTKVPEAVPFLASTGTECNCSIMALGSGIVENRKVGDHYVQKDLLTGKEVETDQPYSLVFSDVTGMAIEDALAMSQAYDNVQPILVAIGRDHLITALANKYITMVIPYHSSGNTLERYQAMMDIVGESVEDREDFAEYESEHSFAELTDEQKLNREIRTKILTGKYFVKRSFKKPSEAEAKALQNNEYLRQLFIRFYGKDELGNDAKPDPKYVENFDKNGNDADCYHVVLNGNQASVIMPHEYWDKTSTAKDADKQGAAYVKYCESLGYHPVFSGWDSKGRFHEDMDFTKYPGYWKTLIDRCMYNNDGSYHKQQAVRVKDADLSMITASEARKNVVKPLQVNDPGKTAAIADRIYDQVEAKRAVEAEQEKQDKYDAELAKRRKWLEKEGVYIESDAEVMSGPPDAKFSISPEMDDAYMDAVESNNMEQAQELVDKAAELTGYVESVYHGTGEHFNIFRRGNQGIHLGNIEQASQRAKIRFKEDSKKSDYEWGYVRDHISDLDEEARQSLVQFAYKQQGWILKYKIHDAFDGDIMDDQEVINYVEDIFNEIAQKHERPVEGTYLELPTFDRNVGEHAMHLYAKIGNPYVVEDDFVEWTPQMIAKAILNRAEGRKGLRDPFSGVTFNIAGDPITLDRAAKKSLKAIYDREPGYKGNDEAWDALADALESAGYDGIKYLNKYEGDKNSYSFIALRQEDVKSADPVTYREDGSVIPLSERFDPENKDIRYSLPTTDADGKILTDGQMEFYKDSQARDSQGRLLVLYHYSNALFESFDPDLLGTTSGYRYPNTAYGFFVTDDKEFSQQFGENEYKLYANFKNPIIHPYGASYKYSREECEAITRRWLEVIDPEQFDYYEELREDDPGLTLYDYYMDLFSPGESPFEYADYDRKTLEEAGFDAVEIIEGIRDGADKPTTSYALFNREQPKFVDNADPTDAPELRFSIPSEREVTNYALDKAESTSDIWYTDPVLQEGRVRFSTSSDNFVNRVKTDWRETRETGGRTLDTNSVETDVRSLVKTIMKNSEVDKKYDADVTDQATDAVKEIFRLFKSGKLEDAARYAWDAAEDIVKNVEYVDDDMYQKYKGVITYLADTKIAAPYELMDDPEFSEFVTENLAKFLVKKRGEDIRNVYTHLNKSWPKMFPELDHPVDMFLQISEVMDAIQPYTEAYSSEEAAKLTEETAAALVEIAKSGEAYRSAADIMNPIFDEQTKAMKQRHREALKNVRNRRDELLSEEKEKRARQKERADKWKEKYNARVQKDAEKRKERKQRQIHKKLYDSVLKEYKSLTDRLLKPSKDRTKNIPEQLRQPLAEMLAAFDLEKEKSKELEEKYRIPTRTQINFRQIKDALESIVKEEGAETEFDVYLNYIGDKITALADKMDAIGEYTIDALDAEDIDTIQDMLTGIDEAIKNWHQLEIDGEKYQAQQVCDDVGEGAKDHQKLYGKAKEFSGPRRFMDNIMNMGELTPIYFFRQIKGIYDMYRQLRKGFDSYVQNEKVIIDKLSGILSPYYKKNKKGERTKGSTIEEWRHSESAETFDLTYGSIRLTVAQKMSLYCLARREGALAHMYSDNGGIVASEITPGSKMHKAEEMLKGKEIQVEHLTLTPADVEEIITTLTEDQKNVADQLQKLMSEDMSEIGNKTSMKLIGIRMYKEKDYFPIKVQGDSRGTNLDKIGMREKVRNPGFSNPLQDNATNPIVIDDIFSVVASHCNEMNMYAAYAVPLTNFMKVYNGSVINDKGISVKIKEVLRQTYGDKAIQYIENFLDDINGNSFRRKGGLDDVLDKAIGQAKKAAVFANLRVALQQPTAIIRALAVMNPKYFAGVLPSRKATQEMFEHCPIALWKSWGYYDTHFGRDIEDVMMGEDVPSKVSFWMSEIYGTLDNMTWGMIWQAVKKEVDADIKAKGLKIEKGSQEYWDMVNERASFVFDSTQVVDSPFHRSNDMRSKDRFTKQMTSFMAEPTLSFNMLRQGIVDAYEAIKKKETGKATKTLLRVAGVWGGQALAVALAQSIVDALRRKGHKKKDDDEDATLTWYQEFMKYFSKNFGQNFWDDVNPINNVYWFKDFVPGIVNALKGEYVFGQSNLAFQWYDAITSGIQKCKKKWEKGDEDSNTWYDCLTELLGGFGYIAGFPAKTVMRGAKNAIHWFNKITGMTVFADDGRVVDKTIDSFLEKVKSNKEESEGGGLFDSIANKMGYRKIGSSDVGSETTSEGSSYSQTADDLPDNLTDEQKQDILKAGEKRAKKNEGKEAEAKEQLDYDTMLYNAMKAAAGLEGEEYNKKVYSSVAQGLKGYIADGDYVSIGMMRTVIEEAGGDVEYFDQRVMDETKSAYKKTLKYDMTYEERWNQKEMYRYMMKHGMTQEELSSEILYKSDLATDMKVAYRVGDNNTIYEAMLPLVDAGMTDVDFEKLYKNRNRMNLEKYKKNGRYKDLLKSTGTFIWPVNGYMTITSKFGPRGYVGPGASRVHPAIDIGCPNGTPISAADGGVVIVAGWNGGYGNSVGIKHDNGMVTYYNHLSDFNVKVGDTVAQGQRIAASGNTGTSYGGHLDFKVLDKDGNAVDPEKYLDTSNVNYNL